MKIYYGPNILELRETTLKDLILKALDSLENKNAIIKPDRFSDDSASWIDIQQNTVDDKAAISICIMFNPDNDTDIEKIELWKSKYILDEDNMKSLLK